MEISTTLYQFAYGKAPRGQGYWAFTFYTKDDKRTTRFCPGEKTYREAKKWALAHELATTAVKIEVGS